MISQTTIFRTWLFFAALLPAVVVLESSQGAAQQPTSTATPVQTLTQTLTLSGVVRDATTNERIPYATVSVVGARIGTRTNPDGFFTLSGVPDSAFTLQARSLGYVATTMRVNAGSKRTDVVIKLAPQGVSTNEVRVTAQRTQQFLQAEKDASLITISPVQLASLPSVGQSDIFRSLQLLPGISGTNDGSSGLYVRGGSPDQNLVLFDGMTVYHVDHFFGFFSAFNPDAVKDVQFYKGGYPAMYGGRLSSVVDITGKTGTEKGIHATAGANLLSFNAAAEVPLSDKATAFAAFRRSYKLFSYESLYKSLTGTDFNSTSLRPPGATVMPFPGGSPPSGGPPAGSIQNAQTPDSYFHDINAKFTYNVSPKDIFAVSFFNSSDIIDKSQDLSGLSLPGLNSNFRLPKTTDKNVQTNIGASAKWFHQWDDASVQALYTNAVLAYSQYSSEYAFGIENGENGTGQQTPSLPRLTSSENNVVRDLTLRVDNQWLAFTGHEIGFGTNISYTSTDYTLTQSSAFNTNSNATSTLDLRERAVQATLYGQDKWKLADNLDVTYGLRGTYYSPTQQFYVEPRVSARWSLTPEFSLKGASGLYYQFVNRIVNENITQGSRDFWVVADSKLTPGYAQHYIAGASFETDDFLFDMEGYYKPMTGLVEYSQRFQRSEDDKYNFLSGTGTARGVEFLLQKKRGWLTGWLGYTLGRVEHIFPDISANPFPALQDQTHEFKAVANIDLGENWNLSNTFIYGSGRPFTAPSSQYEIELLDGSKYSYVHVGEKNAYRLPAYQRWDASITKKFGDAGTSIFVGLSVFNILNHTNVSYYKYDFTTSPVIVTEVKGLGITPTLFVQIQFDSAAEAKKYGMRPAYSY